MIRILLLLPAITLSACAETHYIDYPDGRTEFYRTEFVTNVAITGLTASTDKNGARHIDLQGYKGDQSETLEAISKGLAEGAVRGAKGGLP